jgi:pimeloyl-ACP methyl ester carboxylesterase
MTIKLIQPRTGFKSVNELKLNYIEWGDARDKTILLLHGFMGHAHVWDDLAADLSTHYRVLALDQRGHGDSGWSKNASYSIDSHFADISAFIESFSLKKIILLGHSMGGRNAFFYTACAPEKVEKLLLVDTRLKNTLKSSNALRQQAMSLPLQPKKLDEAERALLDLYPYMNTETCKHIVKHGFAKKQNGRYVAKFDDRMSIQLKNADYKTDDLWHLTNNVTCPTLLIRGKESPFVSANEVKKMCMAIEGSEFKEIGRATHMPIQENLNASKNAIKKFIKIK